MTRAERRNTQITNADIGEAHTTRAERRNMRIMYVVTDDAQPETEREDTEVIGAITEDARSRSERRNMRIMYVVTDDAQADAQEPEILAETETQTSARWKNMRVVGGKHEFPETWEDAESNNADAHDERPEAAEEDTETFDAAEEETRPKSAYARQTPIAERIDIQPETKRSDTDDIKTEPEFQTRPMQKKEKHAREIEEVPETDWIEVEEIERHPHKKKENNARAIESILLETDRTDEKKTKKESKDRKFKKTRIAEETEPEAEQTETPESTDTNSARLKDVIADYAKAKSEWRREQARTKKEQKERARALKNEQRETEANNKKEKKTPAQNAQITPYPVGDAQTLAVRPPRPSVLKDFMMLIVKILSISLAFALLFTFLFGITRYTEAYMEPAVKDGDLVLSYRYNGLYLPGDVVLLEFNGQKQARRVIATAGDVVDITENGVTINGALQQEREIVGKTTQYEEGIQFPVTVPEGQVFVLADNREGATDSRIYGCVKTAALQGKVMTVIRRRSI